MSHGGCAKYFFPDVNVGDVRRHHGFEGMSGPSQQIRVPKISIGEWEDWIYKFPQLRRAHHRRPYYNENARCITLKIKDFGVNVRCVLNVSSTSTPSRKNGACHIHNEHSLLTYRLYNGEELVCVCSYRRNEGALFKQLVFWHEAELPPLKRSRVCFEGMTPLSLSPPSKRLYPQPQQRYPLLLQKLPDQQKQQRQVFWHPLKRSRVCFEGMAPLSVSSPPSQQRYPLLLQKFPDQHKQHRPPKQQQQQTSRRSCALQSDNALDFLQSLSHLINPLENVQVDTSAMSSAPKAFYSSEKETYSFENKGSEEESYDPECPSAAYGSEEESYDPDCPVYSPKKENKKTDEYDPESPSYDPAAYGSEEESYDPDCPVYSPKKENKKTDEYDPESPSYDPAAYGSEEESYDPDCPVYSPKKENKKTDEYDPESPSYDPAAYGSHEESYDPAAYGSEEESYDPDCPVYSPKKENKKTDEYVPESPSYDPAAYGSHEESYDPAADGSEEESYTTDCPVYSPKILPRKSIL
jgi:hypothetical protein